MTHWPSIQYEQQDWVSQYLPGTASRTAMRRHRGPYRAAVVPEIAGLPVSLPAGVLAASSDAAQEMARFDAELGREIAPFAVVLLRSESAASSQIENLTASARGIAEAEIGERAGGNARQVVGNVAAMKAALVLDESVSAESILAMHRALLGHSDPAIAGRWRSTQVWVGGSPLGPHTATFVPPHHAAVPAAIDDLVAFIDRTDVPALAHVAIAHAQFETIHPFPDGNGRTGRALMHAMLRRSGLVRNVTVPISAGLLVDVDEYFAALTAYRAGDLGAIVQRVSDAAFSAVTNGRRLVADLHEVRTGWNERIRARRDSAAWQVADLVLRNPVINVSLVSQELGIAPQNVYRVLAPLVDAGVLTPTTRQRDRVWHSAEVLAAVDGFARRAGRRRGS